MLLNNACTKIISSCGWVDRAGLLVVDWPSRRASRVGIGDSEYISLKSLSSDSFLSAEHFKGEQLVLSIRPFEAPERALASVIVTADNLTFSGENSLWKTAPRYYVESLKHRFQGNDYRLIDLCSCPGFGVFPSLPWFDDSYDKGYQGVMDVIEIPGAGLLLFSVQRSSSPVLYDPVKQVALRKLQLAGRAGNPIFSFNRSRSEMWCVDYDTLIKMRVSDFKILKSSKLQAPASGMTMQNIGSFALDPSEKYCAVARPFSGDVLLLDADSFKVVSRAKSEKQPLSVALLPDLQYVCRDWKSGELEFGRFEVRKSFWSFLNG